MKKRKAIIITIIVIIIIFITTLTIIYFKNENDEPKNEIVEEQVKEIIEENPVEVEDVYVDNNPIKIGLYTQGNSGKKLVTEYSCNWNAEVVMGLFYAIPTNDVLVTGKSFEYVWKEYLNKYPNVEKYRIGYNIKFTLNTGEVVDQIILNPDHAYLMFPKVQLYLYDDVNLIEGRRYYHITQGEMTEKTQCTSVKLVGDKETKNITSPIELTAFTFDGKEDFDPVTGKYRGNSYYTILINRK